MGSDNSKQAAKPPPFLFFSGFAPKRAPPTKARVFSSSPTKAQVKLKQLLAALAAQTGQKEWTKKECEAFEHTLGDPAARPLDKLAAGTKMASQGQAEFASVLEDFNDRLNKLNKKTKNPNGAIPVPMKFRTEVQGLMKELNGYTHEVESFCGSLDQVLDKCDEVFKAKGKDRDINLWISHVQAVLELMHEKVDDLARKADDLHSKFEELEKVLNFEIEEKSEQAEGHRKDARAWAMVGKEHGWKRAWAAGTLLCYGGVIAAVVVAHVCTLGAACTISIPLAVVGTSGTLYAAGKNKWASKMALRKEREAKQLQTTVDQLQEVKEVMGAVSTGIEAMRQEFVKASPRLLKSSLSALKRGELSWDDPSVKEIQAQLDFIRQRNKIVIVLNECLREMNDRFEYY